MTARAALVLVLLAAACSERKQPPPPEPVPSPPATMSPVAIDASVLGEHMLEHFGVIAELQRSLALGRLGDAQRHARWLIDHEEKTREGWPMFVDDMRGAAQQIVDARDLPTASVLAAHLGRTCSRCHERQSALVTFAWEPPPEEAPALVAQMRRHQWAAARLWEGLVGPSNEMWEEGAATLASSKLDAVAAAGGLERGDIPALAAKVRELALRATTLTDFDERAKLYGELLSTCAGCHQLARPRPVPGP